MENDGPSDVDNDGPPELLKLMLRKILNRDPVDEIDTAFKFFADESDDNVGKVKELPRIGGAINR